MGIDGVGSGVYYVDWYAYKCVRDCPVGSGFECGGLSDRDWHDEEFADKRSCCSKYVAYAFDNCMA